MIPGQLTLILPGDLCQMVFPELGLQQKISGVGIIAEDPLHGTLVKHAAALGGISAFVQPFGDGGDTLSSQVVIEDASDDLRFFRNNGQLPVLPAVAQHEESPGDAFFKVPFHPLLLVFAGGETFLLGIACQNGKH